MARRKNKDPWWGYVKAMIRRYPARNSNAEWLCGLDLAEYEAVRQALDDTERWPNGDCVRRLVDMVFFRQSHTLSGAAQRIPCGYETAKRWQQKFVRQVASNFRCDGLCAAPKVGAPSKKE